VVLAPGTKVLQHPTGGFAHRSIGSFSFLYKLDFRRPLLYTSKYLSLYTNIN
jgi:hypothetical protein